MLQTLGRPVGERLHHFGQFGEVKADFGARREMVEAKVDSICTRFDGGLQFGPMSGRAHQFRFNSCSTHGA